MIKQEQSPDDEYIMPEKTVYAMIGIVTVAVVVMVSIAWGVAWGIRELAVYLAK